MAITDTQFEALEEKVEGMDAKLDKIVLGIYGDRDNNYVGLIEKYNNLDKKYNELSKEIEEIHKKNKDQDLLLEGKRSAWKTALEVVKWIGLAYLVAKGVFGVDTFFGKFF